MTSTITVTAWHEHAAHLPYLLGYHPGRAVACSLIRGGVIAAVTCANLPTPTPAAAAEAARACWEALPRRTHDEVTLVVWADSHPEAPPLLQGVRSAFAPPRRFAWGGLVVAGRFQRDPAEPWLNLADVDTSGWVGRGIAPWKSPTQAEALLDDATAVPPGGSAAVMRVWARMSRLQGPPRSASVGWKCPIHLPRGEQAEWAALVTRDLQRTTVLLLEAARVLCDASSDSEGLFCCPCASSPTPPTFLHVRWMIDVYARLVPLALRHRWWLLQALAAYRSGDLRLARAAARRASRDVTLAGPCSLIDAAASRGASSDPPAMLRAITTHFTATAQAERGVRDGRC